VPADAKVALIAAVLALVPALLMRRSLDPSQPGWAVRVYLSLFRTSEVPTLRDAASRRSRFPVREAFLATWFLLFFVLFGIGLFILPEAAHP
jgi:hypothetical protein